MNAAPTHAAAALLLGALTGQAVAGDECPRKEVVDHVRQQFTLYGPLSDGHEYFGFVYRLDGVIQSAVTRSGRCNQGNCLTWSSMGSTRHSPMRNGWSLRLEVTGSPGMVPVPVGRGVCLGGGPESRSAGSQEQVVRSRL